MEQAFQAGNATAAGGKTRLCLAFRPKRRRKVMTLACVLGTLDETGEPTILWSLEITTEGPQSHYRISLKTVRDTSALASEENV